MPAPSAPGLRAIGRSSPPVERPRTAAAREWRRYDRMLGPPGHRAVDAVSLAAGQRVLDVACAAGGCTLEAAHRVGRRGIAVGIDTDGDAIRAARTRAGEQLASWVTFAVADLERTELPVGAFDAVISRFGLANVRDPLRAFERLARGLVPGGRLAFACWRAAVENHWFTLPRRVVAECLGSASGRAVEASELGPRPFAFAERSALEGRLAAAGFSELRLEPFDDAIWIGDDVDDAVELFFETDGRVLDGLLDQRRFERVTRKLRRALAAYERADGVRVPAAAWIVSARRPGAHLTACSARRTVPGSRGRAPSRDPAGPRR